MSTVATPPEASFLERHHFLLRRLHSLTGIIPVGVFLMFHLLANSTAYRGSQQFDLFVKQIHQLPWLVAIEYAFIFIPLAFHGIYGIAIAWEGKLNQNQYPYMDNWRYTLQRVTAYVAFAFILLHLAHIRYAYLFPGGQHFPDENFFEFTQRSFQGMWLPLAAWNVIYWFGTLAVVYHFCNGIVTFCITWGITVGDEARKKVGYGALVIGLVLMAWTTTSLIGLSRAAQGETPEPGSVVGYVAPAEAAH
ncbi:MAG: succinate dehydrogenase [Planctomycetota bacterium]